MAFNGRVLSIAVSTLVAALGAAQAGRLLIVDAKVWDGSQYLEHTSVLVNNGVIVEIGKTITAANAEVVNAAGMVLYPGFIDAYTTSGLKLPDPATAAPARNTTDRAYASMWEANRKGIRSDLVAGDCFAPDFDPVVSFQNGVVTTLFAPGSGTIRGECSIARLGKPPVVLNKTFGQEISIRGGGGGGGAGGYPGSLMGIIALMRQTIYDAQGYSGEPKDAFLQNLQAAATGKEFSLFMADTSRDVHRALVLSKELGLKPIIVGGREAYQMAPVLAENKTPVIIRVDMGSEPSLTGDDTTPAEIRKERRDEWLERTTNLAVLLKARVPVALTSDGGRTDFLKNARNLLKYGVSAPEVLSALTSGGANILGLGSRCGSIKVGMDGDFVLMSANFEDDKSVVKAVIVSGKMEVVK
ncbi:MAG: amidohydrolase family protein [Fimbriimonadaceae bacterium]